MHTHTRTNIYGVGAEVNVTSCSTASNWLQLCLNPAVTWPPPQLNSLPSCLPLSRHTSYITLPPPHTHIYAHIHTPPSPSTSSSLQCHQQQHHSSQDSGRALQGPLPPPRHLGVEQRAGQAGFIWLAAPPPPLRGHTVGAVMSRRLVYPYLLSSSVATYCTQQHLA